MKKLFKRAMSAFLAGVIAISAMAVTSVVSFADEGDDTTTASTYEFYYEKPGSSTPLVTAENVTLWINGGKATLASGTIVDGKSVQLSVYEKTADGEYYNITNAKDVVWGVSLITTGASLTTTQPDLSDKGKFTDVTAKDNAKVSKGKVTVAKSAPETGKTAVVWAYRVTKDAEKKIVVTKLGGVTLDIQAAPTGVVASDTISDAGVVATDKANVVKTTAVPVGGVSSAIYVGSTIKTGTVSADTTYTISSSNAEVATVAVYVDGTSEVFAESISGLKAADLAKGFVIKGVGLKDGKITKATITITNENSGKSTKVTANVDNQIVTVASLATASATTVEIADKNQAATTKDYTLLITAAASATAVAPYIVSALGDAATTDKITVAVTTDAIVGADYTGGADEAANTAAIAAAKAKIYDSGKVKISATKSTLVKAAYKDGKLTITVPKQAAPTSATTVNVIVATANTWLVVPVILAPKAAATTEATETP